MFLLPKTEGRDVLVEDPGQKGNYQVRLRNEPGRFLQSVPDDGNTILVSVENVLHALTDGVHHGDAMTLLQKVLHAGAGYHARAENENMFHENTASSRVVQEFLHGKRLRNVPRPFPEFSPVLQKGGTVRETETGVAGDDHERSRTRGSVLQ